MDLLIHKKVKTRKPHKCWGCRRQYPAGATLTVCVQADGGTILRTYWCPVCQSIISGMDEYEQDDGFGYGELRDNTEDWEDQRVKIEGSAT
ncbi:MAG: hypothetical protein IMZ62_12885 [Chloroflexi bacterium]|nr:hypothetical protein [Chloroflexota bacterium]MBE3119099.1 hypothetical protein [Candidatus Atribacteria bacterium]